MKVKYPVAISGNVQHIGRIQNRNRISGTSLYTNTQL